MVGVIASNLAPALPPAEKVALMAVLQNKAV